MIISLPVAPPSPSQPRLDSHMGLHARLMSQALRKLTAVISKSNTSIIFINQIREFDKDVVVIMVTGVKDDDTINQALDLGANDYITKPLSLEYLEKVVLLKFINSEIRDLGKI